MEVRSVLRTKTPLGRVQNRCGENGNTMPRLRSRGTRAESQEMIEHRARPTAACDRPKVFVVTPSLNQAEYLPATIESVLSQDYQPLEYFVADGGSTDGSVDILRSYGGRVRWRSHPDLGQAAAVADAWAHSDADLVAWLNSDDTYEPGAISEAVRFLVDHPEVDVVYGKAWHIDRRGRRTGEYPTQPFDAAALYHSCFICQPAAVLRRRVLGDHSLPDPSLCYALDYDLWIRLSRSCRFGYLPRYLASSRIHSASKTFRERDRLYREAVEVTQRHFGIASRNWSVAELLYRSRQLAGRWLLPERARQRLVWALSTRAESKLVGPLYADGWAGSQTHLRPEPEHNGRLRLDCEVPFWPFREPLRVTVSCNGTRLLETETGLGPFSIELEIPAEERESPLLLRASRTFIPERWGLSPDPRPMSFLVRPRKE